MAVFERATVPSPAERRATALDRSRSNLTLLSFAMALAFLLGIVMSLTTGGTNPETGDPYITPVIFGAFAAIALAFSTAAAAAAFVLSGLRDAALAER